MTDDADLAHDEECPVCGTEYGDGFDRIEEGQTIEDVRLCVIDMTEENHVADSIIHLP